ncbi:hypothetical protein Ciccas_007635, partial [Cichlidogyrus casuarinus]
ISFTPHEVGEHLVSVYCAGSHIVNSPFKIFVSQQEIGDANRVRICGKGITQGTANVANEFLVDTREAGYANISLSIEGPSKADIDCHENVDGTCLITYNPSEPGTYYASVKFGDKHVPGSPFEIYVDGMPTARESKKVTTQRSAVNSQAVGSQCEMRLKIPGVNLNDLLAEVVSPTRNTVPCSVVNNDQGQYVIRFVPTMLGVHTVYVYHRGINLPGSPFQFTIGPIQQGGANKVRVAGKGIQQAYTNTPNEFFIYTREAGDGPLSVAIEGPSKAEIDFEDYHDGSCGVTWKVHQPGEYLCTIKFADEHVPFSPFRIYVEESMTGKNVKVASLANPMNQNGKTQGVARMASPEIGRQISFTCHCNLTGSQHLRAMVEAPSGRREEALINCIGLDQYAINFLPSQSGAHMIYVCCLPGEEKRELTDDLLRQYAINGSPFRIEVTQHTCDPAMVHAEGSALTRGRVGARNSFFVNTTNAGSGTLNVSVDGPSKARLTCKELDEGYDFCYIPSAPGKYTISILYGGNFHIVGSPFLAIVEGDPIDPHQLELNLSQESNVTLEASHKTNRAIYRKSDSSAANVRSSGLGLKIAYLDRRNQFTVDASSTELGSDTLLVGITGPRHFPIDQVVVKHLQNNQFAVSYTVEQPGNHTIIVKWGDDHIPGSPFIVSAV